MKIGVVHPNLMLKGGGEYVTIEIIQALREENDIELISFQKSDVEELNSFFDTDLEEEDFSVRTPSISSVFMKRTQGSFFKLRNGLIKNFARRKNNDYDLLISGLNEADFGEPGIQYVHFPDSVNEQHFHETGDVTTDLSQGNNSAIYQSYLKVAEFFKQDRKGVEKNLTICNSSFTRKVYREVFENEAEVVNPPVSIEYDDLPEFKDRKNGLVTIGKVAPPKNQKETIRIVDRLRENGFDIHLHIIGEVPDTEYSREVREMAEKRDYVEIEGRVDRDEMKQMIADHKYGIHNFSGEHYGLAPAEMLKAGCIVFVPDRGGQVDIVNQTEEVLFSDSEEAVEKIGKVLEDESKQQEVLEKLSETDLNSPEDFRKKIREKVADFEMEAGK